jgi:hypothetical protein
VLRIKNYFVFWCATPSLFGIQQFFVNGLRTNKKGAKSPNQYIMDFHFLHKHLRMLQPKESCGIPVHLNPSITRFVFLANNKLRFLWPGEFGTSRSNLDNGLQFVLDHLCIA